jgi:hypothetical protein
MTNSNLKLFPGITTLDHDASVMLELAKNAKLSGVVIVGWDEHGELFFSSNKADGGDVLWLLEKAKRMLLEIGDTNG